MTINNPNKVILHCSASPDSSMSQIGAKELNEIHIARGFLKIGYHDVIKRDGTIEAGRPKTEIGAHCEGHNQDSLGVCYIGTKRPTKAQLKSLCNLYVLYNKDYKIDYKNWFGHYEFNPNKECPSFSMELFRTMLEFFHKLVLR
jgi:N-acetylmuramoyl-L-alanine amidase